MISITKDKNGYITTFTCPQEEVSFRYFDTEEEAQAKGKEIEESRKNMVYETYVEEPTMEVI